MFALLLSQLIRSVGALLRLLGDAFHGFFATIDEARAKSDRFERLAHMSDAELARQGLRREDLARVVLASRSRV